MRPALKPAISRVSTLVSWRAKLRQLFWMGHLVFPALGSFFFIGNLYVMVCDGVSVAPVVGFLFSLAILRLSVKIINLYNEQAFIYEQAVDYTTIVLEGSRLSLHWMRARLEAFESTRPLHPMIQGLVTESLDALKEKKDA